MPVPLNACIILGCGQSDAPESQGAKMMTFFESDNDAYKRDLWNWFLARARTHDGYGWGHLDPKAASHLAECGINYAKSDTPDVGTVSEFDGTDNNNQELDAVTVSTWACNCEAYGDRFGYPRARREFTLAIPGPYPIGQIIYEVINQATEA